MTETLVPYAKILNRWLPGARLARPPRTPGPDAIIRWTRRGHTVTFVAERKGHLATQDVGVVAAQLERWLTAARGRNPRGLLLAPYVRIEQATTLRERGIDYVDLVGNAHLEAPGVFVHVEGKRPAKDHRPAHGRLTKGWVKTVMAFLVRPELLKGPYRPIAQAADVALGTVMACMKDLEMRGFLREKAGDRNIPNVADLIAVWVHTYGDVVRPKLRVRHFQMRETNRRGRWQQIERALEGRNIRWALTGVDGAAVRQDFLLAAETELYADPTQLEEREILKALVAQPAARHGNLRVIEPPAPLAFPPKADTRRPPTAPLLLIYAELRLRGGEQANEAADMLLPELVTHGQS